MIGFTLSWSAACLDFNTYFAVNTSSVKVFSYTMAGLWLPCALIQIAGAAFACAALSMEIDGWADAFTNNSVGGLLGVALLPMGGFGKFLLVILSIGIISNNAPTLYAFSLSIYVVFPFLNRFPKSRPIFPIVATIIYVPLSIVGNNQFALILGNLLGILGYWSAIFSTIVLIEVGQFYLRHTILILINFGIITALCISTRFIRSLQNRIVANFFSSAHGISRIHFIRSWDRRSRKHHFPSL